MLRSFKRWWCLLVLAASVQFAGAFSLLGPFETYQVGLLGYGAPNSPGDLGGPHNLAEEFRWNVPLLSYTYDSSFLNYFGSNGVVAVDQAMAIFNNLTNVSSYSPGLSEFPLETARANYRAQALSLYDLKSLTMSLMMEELAAASPERFTWTLRVRAAPPNTQCPVFVFIVIKRNFDPVTFDPSVYVNGTLYTYQIVTACSPAPEYSDAVEYAVDPLAYSFTSVAGANFGFGTYFTGLTRDDVGALRYMWQTNNMNVENSPPDSTQISGFIGNTDTSTQILVVSSNLATLTQDALVNNAAALQALYPDLQILSTTSTWTNLPVATQFAYFTNSPYDPAGFPPQLVVGTTWTTNVTQIYTHTFGNVITNTYYPNSTVTILRTQIVPVPYAPAGTFGIEFTQKNVKTNVVSGSYFLLPTNLCGISILYTQLVTTVTTTNLDAIAVPPGGIVLPPDITLSSSTISYFTNYYVVANPIICAGGGGTNTTTLRQGMERLRFIRRDYDSLLGQFYTPFETNFTLYGVSGNKRTPQEFRRTVGQPDFLFLAEDLTSGGTTWPISIFIASRTIAFGGIGTAGSSSNNLAGPGIMSVPISITYNKMGPYIVNQGPAFVTEPSGQRGYVYGSFDGSTNEPVVYPSGRSIMSLEAQVFMQITTTALPDGKNGAEYSGGGLQLTGSGGTVPYVWTMTPGSPALPPGLTLSSSGVISGKPSQSGTFSFGVRMTDFGQRAVDAVFTLTVNP